MSWLILVLSCLHPPLIPGARLVIWAYGLLLSTAQHVFNLIFFFALSTSPARSWRAIFGRLAINSLTVALDFATLCGIFSVIYYASPFLARAMALVRDFAVRWAHRPVHLCWCHGVGFR